MSLKNEKLERIRDVLELKADLYNRVSFIEKDPVSIPHLFSKKQDIEIMGFFAAIFAWGQRATIINKCKELTVLLGQNPYDFMLNHQPKDLKPFLNFKHRTFNATDLLYFISFFKWFYSRHESLEEAFFPVNKVADERVKDGLIHFGKLFFSLDDVPKRTIKHIASPENNSTCKRLNMFLRWMVRSDNKGVDFGLWKKIKPAELICPLDSHVERVARKFGLITRQQVDWKTVMELTDNLRLMDPVDPIKYDFALFGLGVEEKFGMKNDYV